MKDINLANFSKFRNQKQQGYINVSGTNIKLPITIICGKKEGKTAIMVTHDIAEAISMSDRIILLSKRPSYVKNIYNIEFKEKSIPTENRKKEEFASYYTNIWKELDHHV